MDSFISHSNGWFPRRAFTLLLVAIAAWAGCILYSTYINPEVVYYSQGDKIKNAWAKKMTHDYGHKIVVFGGSSCEFSVDGEHMLKNFNLPTVNYGRHAGMGASIMAEAALDHLQPGDTLIIALEPSLLTKPLTEPSLAMQFSFSQRHPEWLLNPALGIGRVNWFEAANLLRPGGYNVFTMLGKIAMGEPLYRYKVSDFRSSGWATTDVRLPIDDSNKHGANLSNNSLLLLQKLRDWCDARNIHAAYSLPWAYSPPEKMKSLQKENIQFLLQMTAIFPVLKDSYLGIDTNRADFADTNYHLVAAAAETRSDELAREIINWNVWTTEELKSLEKTF